MSQTTDPVELQRFRPYEVGHNANVGHATSTPHSLLIPPSSAASSIGTGSSQKEAPSPPEGLPSWQRYLVWWPEFTGVLLSLLSLTAIVVFLIQIEGSKLDDWHMTWQIQPSTILSILVTLCRITLAFFIAEGIGQLKWVFFEQRPHQLSDFESFDKATRGAWGASCFVWNLNRRALVASFGAIMAILVLAMDPFSQQVLHYAPRTSSISNAVATIPSTQIYDSGALYAAFGIDNATASYDSDLDSSSQDFGGPVRPTTSSTSPASDTSIIPLIGPSPASVTSVKPLVALPPASDTSIKPITHATTSSSTSPPASDTSIPTFGDSSSFKRDESTTEVSQGLCSLQA
jgi:hypothetical protein